MHRATPTSPTPGSRLAAGRFFNYVLSAALLATLLATTLAAFPFAVLADPFPPAWQNGSGAAVHFRPVAWPVSPASPASCGPTCGEWRPYQAFSSSINDPRIQDPSNGGTIPQNYVNIASSCIDKNFPSVYYAIDTANQVLFFRWRVEQIANSYAVGPSAGSFATSDPWKSGLWTVFFDLNGDGYRDLAAHLNGSSGDPANAVDRLVGVWGEVPTQSTDYINDPNIHLLAHNPTGFVDTVSNRILNFHNLNVPNALWQNGSAETYWDYGPTRATRITGSGCEEFFIDYQIPLGMLDATSLGGPRLTLTTPFSMLFCTANSLNNPMQKDCAYEGEWTAGPTSPAPFGDTLILQPPSPEPEPEPMTLPQPLVQDIHAESCRPARLSARIGDALYVNTTNNAVSSLLNVDFYYYFDANGNGQPDDGGDWNYAAAATSASPGVWTATWDSTVVPTGSLLIGLQASDDGSLNPDGKVNRTFSYYTDVNDIPGYPDAVENWYVNPTVDGVTHWTTFANACGRPAALLTKTASLEQVGPGDLVGFTLEFTNDGPAALTIDRVEDYLPAGFSFSEAIDNDLGGTPILTPEDGNQGTLVWTFSPAASIPPYETRTLRFTAHASTTPGAYANTAGFHASAGEILSNQAAISVGQPTISLQLTGSPTALYPGNPVVYTLTYSNDSPVNLTNVILTDILPDGLTDVTPSDGGIYNSDTRTVTWSLGDLPAGAGPITVTITATIPSDIPTSPNPLVNEATIVSDQTEPLDRSVNTYLLISSTDPLLSIQKEAAVSEVAPGDTVAFTIRYGNSGGGVAAAAVVEDTVPGGFEYDDAASTPACELVGSTVSCPVGDLSAGESGTVTIAMTAANPYTAANPQTNTASLSSGTLPTVSSSYTIGVSQPGCSNTTYYLRSLPASGLPAPVGLPIIPDNQKYLANTTQPTTLTVLGPVNVIQNAGETEIAHFYLDPAQTTRQSFGTLTQNFYITKTRSNPLTIGAYVYSYNSETGTVTQIGTGFSSNNNGTYTNSEFIFTVTPTAPLNPGERLLWRITATNTNQDNQLSIHINTDPSQLTHVTTCVSSANISFNKLVDKTVAAPGDNLQYTLRFANTGNTAATSATIADTLPPYVTFDSAFLNEQEVTPDSINGTTYTFAVNGPLAAPGAVAAGESGTLAIYVRVNNEVAGPNYYCSRAVASGGLGTYSQPWACSSEAQLTNARNMVCTYGGGTLYSIDESEYYPYFISPPENGVCHVTVGQIYPGYPPEPTSFTLANRATFSATEVVPIDGTAATTILTPSQPDVIIEKSVDRTFLASGDTAVYSLVVTNKGEGPAADVTITDTLPDSAYLEYVLGSAALNGTPLDPDPVAGDVLTHNIGALPAGGSATLTFTMRTLPGIPAGVTQVDNQASVTDASNPEARQSNIVPVFLNGSPILRLEKVVSPAESVAAGGELTYTLIASNIGGGPAEEVVITDAIPSLTRYVAGSLVAAGDSQTDAWDSDEAEFDEANNRVRFHPSSLAAGESYTVSFRVRVEELLPELSNQVPNEAIVTASNAAEQHAEVGIMAQANAPALMLEKTGPESIAFPMARLARTTVVTTTLLVDDASHIAAGVYLHVNGTNTRVQRVNGTSITVDTPVSGSANDEIFASITYALSYANTGGFLATGVTLQDTLPPLMIFADATGGGSFAGGTVSWSLPDLAPGDSGSVQLTVIPTTAAVYNNVAELRSSQTNGVFASHQLTAAGGLVVLKTTATPELQRGPNGVIARWTITVRNTSLTTATNVRVTDLLPQGFTYLNTVSTTGTRTSTINPAASDAAPTWGAWSLPAGESFQITFRAAAGNTIAPGVYLNDVEVTSDTVDTFPFDPFTHPEAEVHVTVRSLEGMVWRDDNANRVIDSPEWPLRDVTLTVYNSANQVVATLHSRVDGSFQIDNLPEGSYRVVATSPAGATNTTPLTVTVVIPENGTGYANFGFLSPTAVTMSPPHAQPAPGRARIAWTTQIEIGVQGFNVYRAASPTGLRQKVNPNLIPAQCNGSMTPCDYTFDDPGAIPGQTYYYWIETVQDGDSVFTEPLEVTPSNGVYLPGLFCP